MFPRKRHILSALWILLASVTVAEEEHDPASAESAILSAARAIIAEDPNCALITLDADLQPRVRTVTASPPEEDLTIWIATRPSTRKARQIRQHDKVTLYFDDDARGSYVSIMGNATLHNDLETKKAKNFHDEGALRAFWPNYPDDYLLIKVVPLWIEVLGHGIEADPETWRPQGVVLQGE